ncbi:MAG: indole-3-glycerol phosphate synthase TrpC [Candidatus Omnitrophica bacterium]|nr:indole-3-glycerol phosphate synthase TrpC [Candidatus Omnitrophota bacterium]
MLQYKQQLLAEKKSYYEGLKKNVDTAQHSRYEIFKKAISKPGVVNLIAEVKKASPSRGVIREDFDALKIARIYVKNGASAISVLTEDKYFLGKPSYLRDISDEVNVPTLMKDFIVHEHQVYEAFVCGASAILLIVALLEDRQITQLMQAAHRLGMDCLVEVHNAEELDRALELDAEIIGINNRNLHTLVVDKNTCLQLVPRVPQGKIIVAESGLENREDLTNLKKLGVHAVLIGETFMKAEDIGVRVREIIDNI